eukprot:GHVS01008123.1.p2 GENE.GHVS01008123.1~~GHVS01008123.1.p2  ORF type:complete len:191 (+),score=8.74 GHVS01008123.1:401-973(+)
MYTHVFGGTMYLFYVFGGTFVYEYMYPYVYMCLCTGLYICAYLYISNFVRSTYAHVVYILFTKYVHVLYILCKQYYVHVLYISCTGWHPSTPSFSAQLSLCLRVLHMYCLGLIATYVESSSSTPVNNSFNFYTSIPLLPLSPRLCHIHHLYGKQSFGVGYWCWLLVLVVGVGCFLLLLIVGVGSDCLCVF